MAQQLFVDETKRSGFVMVAAAISSHKVALCRKDLRALLRPRQRRIHFKSEGSSTRNSVIDVLHRHGVVGYPVAPKEPSEILARAAALREVISIGMRVGANRIVIERDESFDLRDRDVLTKVSREFGSQIRWELAESSSDSMLWAADALAWCYLNPNSYWRTRIESLIVEL